LIYSLEKILTASQKVPHVCYPLLSKGGILVIGAPAKMRKSFLAMQLSYCLAAGTQFLDEYAIPEKHQVLYIEKEIGIPGVRERADLIHKQMGRDSDATANLHFLPKGGKEARNLTLGSPQLLAIVEKKNPDILVLDPLRRFHRADEDSSGEMEKVFDAVEELQGVGREENQERSIILIHHCGKPSEFRNQDEPVSLRGSSFIFDAGDSYIMMQRKSKKTDEYTLNFTFRHTADKAPLKVRFEDGIFVKAGKSDE
jgi:RecA-family ATPase